MTKAKTTLKLTLEEYGYKLSDLIYPSNGLEMAIEEAMKRHAEFYHESKVKKLNKPAESLALYDDEPFEKIREVVCRGGRGIDGKQPLKYVPLKDIDDEWLGAIIDYEEQYRPNNKYLPIYYKELNYRNGKDRTK